MKMKKSILILILLGCILVSSCQGVKESPNQKMIDDLNRTYLEKKSFFLNDLTNHFPHGLNENNITYTDNVSPEMGSLELMVIDSVSTDTLLLIQKNLERICKGKYNSSDTCLFVVDRFLSTNKYYKLENTDYDKRLIERPCYTGRFPVPNFWHNDFTTNETECQLPDDFVLYVIDAKQGEFLKEELLTNGWFMPKQWKNGYSKGLAISRERNIIIYWLVIW